VQSPEAVSNAASAPKAVALVPTTAEKLPRRLAFRPTLALMTAWAMQVPELNLEPEERASNTIQHQ
jgi:hypothetical protein